MTSVTAINKAALVKLLHEQVLKITFTKADKSVREMLCTLLTDFLPENQSYSSNSPNNDDTSPITVWDLEKSAWRSIKPETIIKAELI